LGGALSCNRFDSYVVAPEHNKKINNGVRVWEFNTQRVHMWLEGAYPGLRRRRPHVDIELGSKIMDGRMFV
jgi:hypothetical protein